MPWNGAGVFNRIYSWVADKNAGIDITASRMDTDTDDITADGLGNALTRDGQGIATANLPMGTFRHTNVGDGVARTDYASVGQAQDSSLLWGGTSAGSAGAWTVTLVPAIVAYASGQIFRWIAGNDAAGNDTFNISGKGAKNAYITDDSGVSRPSAGAWKAGQVIEAVYNAALNSSAGGFQIFITSPATPAGAVMPFAGSASPSGWLLCSGQAVSRTTYAVLFAVISTTYGAGDGSTTFNVPDLRGRSVFGVDNMGGSAANRVTNAVSGITGTTLGASGGDQNVQSHTHVATSSVTDPTHSHGFPGGNFVPTISSGTGNNVTGGTGSGATNTTAAVATGITVGTTNATFGSGSSANMPPAMMMNCIIKT